MLNRGEEVELITRLTRRSRLSRQTKLTRYIEIPQQGIELQFAVERFKGGDVLFANAQGVDIQRHGHIGLDGHQELRETDIIDLGLYFGLERSFQLGGMS